MNWWDRYNLQNIVGPKYTNLQYLGEGLNGVVFRAMSRLDKIPVAIKFVRITKKNKTDRKRLKTEIYAMMKLKGNCAVEIYDSNVEANPPFYVMEYLRIGDLRKKLETRLDSISLLSIFLKICSCVETSNNHDITHRDIKPENVLFRSPNTPILSDFGICKLGKQVSGTRVTEMQRRGTPLYMAPEQLSENLEQSKPADVYALGIMLHFDIAEPIKNPDLRDKLADYSDQCTANDPNRRCSIEVLVGNVEGVLSDARQYKLYRARVRRIINLVEAMSKRLPKSMNILREEEAYLRERIQEFNEIATYKDEYRNHGLILEDKRTDYSVGFVDTGYRDIYDEDFRDELREEAANFSAHLRKYLRNRK